MHLWLFLLAWLYFAIATLALFHFLKIHVQKTHLSKNNMLKRSKFKIGEFLVTTNGNIFIHDGHENSDGYGCLIGMRADGTILKQSDWGNFMRYPIDHIASDKEIDILMRKIMATKHITNY